MKILSTFDHYSSLSLFLDRGLLASKVPTLAWYFTLNYRSALCKGLSMKYVRWDVKSFARRTWEKLEVSISCDIVGDAASLSTDWEGKAKLLLFRFSGKGKLCKCAQCTASRKCCLLYFFAIAPFPPPCKGDQKNIAYNNDSLKSWIFPLYARVIKSMTVSGFPSWQKKSLTVEFQDNGISRKKLTRENRHHVLQKCSYSFPIHDTVFPQYSIWNRATCCLQEAPILEELWSPLLMLPGHLLLLILYSSHFIIHYKPCAICTILFLIAIAFALEEVLGANLESSSENWSGIPASSGCSERMEVLHKHLEKCAKAVKRKKNLLALDSQY